MISVIIPVRNAEKTIERAIRSVVDQKVPDIEILCIINGTTDNSEKVIENLDIENVKILHSSPGIVSALNEGIRQSKGELIARQDADDIWHSEKLKKQTNFLQNNSSIDILGTQLCVVDGSGKFIRNTSYPTTHNEIVNSLLSSVNPIGHPSVMFRKRILDKCAGYFDLFPLAEDLDLWTRAAAWYRFANIDEALVTYQHVPNPTYNPQVPQTLTAWYKMIYGVK